MIRMIGQNGYRTVNLLRQHHAHQHMRPGHCPQRQLHIGAGNDGIGKAVRTANGEHKTAATLILGMPKPFGEFFAG